MNVPVLSVRDLVVSFATDNGSVRPVDGVSFDLHQGRVLALVGESGCGKSVTSAALLRLIQPPGKIAGGSITYHPHGRPAFDAAQLSRHDQRLYDLRGAIGAMIFQEPMTALSPVHTIGDQIVEAIRLHQPLDRSAARALAAEMLGKVGIPSAAERLDRYPFELSGGMRQRVVIAMALVCKPQVLIADEPTTALDVTIQAQVLRLIRDLQRELGTAVLLITHDLGVVAQTADDVAVMYCGRIVEQGPVRDVLKSPRHPYTRGLLASLPSLHQGEKRLNAIPLSVPPLHALPQGCAFHPRCPHALAGLCDVGQRPLLDTTQPHGDACLRSDQLTPKGNA